MPCMERWSSEWGQSDAASEVLRLKRFANRGEQTKPSGIPLLGRKGNS